MRKISTVVITLLAFMTVIAEEYKPLPMHYAGSMMPYDFRYAKSEPCWPDSLTPVYLAHVARHGARYISSEKKIDILLKAIAQSEAKGCLTSQGRNFSALLDSIKSRSAGRWGALSGVGIEEEQRIARNLHSMMPQFLNKARIRAVSSYVPRVVLTMYEFCHELSRLTTDISISTSEGKEFNPLVRCFETDSAYNAYRDDGNWRQIYRAAVETSVSPEPARRILGMNCGLSDSGLREVTMEMYDILQSLSAFGMSAPTTEFMSEEEYRACWQADNLEHYLRNTVTPYSDLAATATAPLLRKIITDADEALSAQDSKIAKSEDHQSVNSNCYFGHAETLMPLLSLMRLPGCYYDSTDIKALAEHWRDYDIVPLGAHLDLIFLKAPSGRIMVAVLLNGRSIAPIAESDRPSIIDWTVYKEYLLSCMRES